MSTRSSQAVHVWILTVLLAATVVVAAQSHVRAHAPSPVIVLGDDSWSWSATRSRVENFVHNSFRSRARLIQVSAVAVAIGIFIMFRCRRTS